MMVRMMTENIKKKVTLMKISLIPSYSQLSLMLISKLVEISMFMPEQEQAPSGQGKRVLSMMLMKGVLASLFYSVFVIFLLLASLVLIFEFLSVKKGQGKRNCSFSITFLQHSKSLGLRQQKKSKQSANLGMRLLTTVCRVMEVGISSTFFFCSSTLDRK